MSALAADETPVIGWDVGGAHLKACLLRGGRVVDVAQWPAPMWQGLTHLDAALHEARLRWPHALSQARHGVTMTAEMADLFADREDGVRRLAAHMAGVLGPAVRFFAGEHGWCAAGDVRAQWANIASANWLATAMLVARHHPDAILVDIGSTTTDLIPIVAGHPVVGGHSDADRLASGGLVYIGVVRTPLCALAARIGFKGVDYNVMNELFATSADVFRLTGELSAAHDQYPPADNGDKDTIATARRLARMIGHDAHTATPDDWVGFAQTWRATMLACIADNLDRVTAMSPLPANAPLVTAGCGRFLAADLAHLQARTSIPFSQLVSAPPPLADWVDVCAPCVAVALLAPAAA